MIEYLPSDINYTFKPFTFTTRMSKIPGRSGHRVVCNDRHMYVFGGYNPSLGPSAPIMHGDVVWANTCPLFKELWRYNFASDIWTRTLVGGGIPNQLASNAVVLNGEFLMVYGGTSIPFGESRSNRLYVFNTKNGTRMCPIGAKGNFPQKLYGQAIVVDKQYLYTVGGTTGHEYNSDIYQLNLETKTWEEIYVNKGQNGPSGLYRHEMVLFNNKIYIFGGGTADTVCGFEVINVFNLTNREWETLDTHGDPTMTPPGIPAARRCHGCVQLPYNDSEKCVVICGGYDGEEILSDVWKFDLITLYWTCLKHCSLPRPVYFHSTAISPAGQLFIFGGIVKIGDKAERTAEVYCAWMCIPKLSEICWEVLTRTFLHLHTIPQNKLLALGIPQKFICRLK